MSADNDERVRRIIAGVRHVPIERVSLDSSLEQLGFDSLEGVTLLFALEDEFHVEIPDECLQQKGSIRELIHVLEGLIPAGPASKIDS
jgi:acyl carrier protein